MFNTIENVDNLRVIKTARTEASINTAAEKGFMPLIKVVNASEDIKSKFAVLQNKTTGKIEVSGDYRFAHKEGYEMVIDFTWYYPHKFESPFAAYLIPKDIMIGEKVFIEDLIEDLVGMCWNQGNVFRLDSANAIWNGKDFDIEYTKKEDLRCVIG
jgi:hypothetical protein